MVWRNGLWFKMWRGVRSLNANNRSCIFGRENFRVFSINQGMSQGCPLSPKMFTIHNGLLCENETHLHLGVDFQVGVCQVFCLPIIP